MVFEIVRRDLLRTLTNRLLTSDRSLFRSDRMRQKMRTFVVNCTQARIGVWHAILAYEWFRFVYFGVSPVQIATKITWVWELRHIPKQSSNSTMFLCCCEILYFTMNALHQSLTLTEDVKSKVIPFRPVLSTQIQFAKINIESHRSNELSSPQPSSQMSFYVCWFNAAVLLQINSQLVGAECQRNWYFYFN